MRIKIISGGQTGADQGALVAAKQVGLETGGWAPKGWMTEDGPFPELGSFYGLTEYRYRGYAPRTRANVRDSDVTLWFGRPGTPGFKCTRKACLTFTKPFFINPTVADVRAMLEEMTHLRVWNVAGNRESRNPGLHRRVVSILKEALSDGCV